MPQHYDQTDNSEVALVKVTKPFAKLKGAYGEIIVTKGNYYVKHKDGRLTGVHADDVERLYPAHKNQELIDSQKASAEAQKKSK